MSTRSVVVLVTVALVGACYGGNGAPTPVGPSEIMSDITRNGMAIDGAIAGDAGCADSSLIDNATHLRVSLPPDTAVRDVYLFAFKSASYATEAPLVDACRQALATASQSTIDQLDVPPYRVFGSGWSPAFRQALMRALTEAARGGDAVDRRRPD